jgi:predicted adenine nucleotide alpha hydrolase (AANH) superfamily ATPase
MKTNYQLLLDDIIKNIPTDTIPTLLLHSCCGPCSSYVLEYLSNYFKITIFYYNPNIDSLEEFTKRLNEQKRLINEMTFKYPVSIIVGNYENKWYQEIKGLESDVEGGERCHKCYEMRLRESALLAKQKNYDYFTTTLSISPYKDSLVLNTLGISISKEIGIKYLYADFKKREGYKRSIELSKKYQLYRQDYCGCIYSKINSHFE